MNKEQLLKIQLLETQKDNISVKIKRLMEQQDQIDQKIQRIRSYSENKKFSESTETSLNRNQKNPSDMDLF